MTKIIARPHGSFHTVVNLTWLPDCYPRTHAWILANYNKPRFARALVNALERGIPQLPAGAADDQVDLNSLAEEL